MSAADSTTRRATAASEDAAPGGARVAWVDYSKGICIFLVVMLHANLEVQDSRGATGWLQYVVEFARPFRMPDFFLIAGLFLSNALRRPWRVYLDRKVAHFAYFYVLWAAIQFVLFESRYQQRLGGTAVDIGKDYLLTFIEPVGSLWFIHSLALYFVIVRLTRRVPPWLILLLTGGLQCLGPRTGWTVPDEFAQRFVYFYSGYVFAPQIFRLADWSLGHAGRALGYLAVWGVVEQYCVAHGWSTLPGVGLALGYVGAIAVVFAGGLLSRLSWTSWLRYLGENSIVVYLGYYTAERIAVAFGASRLPDIGSAALVLTVCSVIGALLMREVAMRLGLTFLYVRPRWARLPPDLPVRRTAVAPQVDAAGG